MDPRRTPTVLAALLFAVALAECVTTVIAGAASDLSAGELLDGFAVSNAIIGLSLAAAGLPIAWHRPGNPVGWLLQCGGCCYATSAAGYALLAAGTSPGERAPGWRIVATVTNAGWPWAIGLFLPAALLFFPDGRLPGPRWRWVLAAAVVATVPFVASAVVPSQTLSTELGVSGYLSWSRADEFSWVGAVGTVLGNLVYVAVVASLILRFRRGDERVRRQLLWLLLAALVMVTAFVLSDALSIESWLAIFAVALVPLAVAVAILRHQLLDIRLVVSRSVLYLLLTAAAVGVYVGLVAVLETAVRRQVGLGSSVLATLLIAAAFNPARVWLQRRIDRIFYGARGDPVHAIAQIGARLGDLGADGTTGLTGVLEALCRVMRLPSASIVTGGREIAGYGSPPPLRQTIALGHALGELTVGLRPGESRLDPADERVLLLLSASLAVAVHASSLAEQLGGAREALVTAREEERRRLRRDLHDGLGPALTGVVLKADAARRLALTEPERAAALMAELRAQTTAAIDDVRRLVNELRPPALDGLGLVGALREQATTLSRRSDGSALHVSVEAAEPLTDLPAAVEVAAYRIATEALTNVTRHSTSSSAIVSLTMDRYALTVRVDDNGGSNGAAWQAGVGLTSMRERAAELGGSCRAGPELAGGRVTVTLPLGGRR